MIGGEPMVLVSALLRSLGWDTSGRLVPVFQFVGVGMTGEVVRAVPIMRLGGGGRRRLRRLRRTY